MNKPVTFTLEENNVLTSALRLKRESLLRSRNKEIAGSKLFELYNAQLNELSALETKLFALVS